MLELHTKQWNDFARVLINGGQTFVFLGDRGIGKRTLVRSVAQRLSAKLIEFDKFRVGDARDLRSTCTRVLSQSHVFLIDGDNTTEQAYNAMLKLLEEPPLRCAFVFACSTTPLQTIVSRCNLVLFPRLTDDELMEVLRFKGMTPAVAASLVPFAMGSVEAAYAAYAKQESRREYLKFYKALVDGDEKFVFDKVRVVSRRDIEALLDLSDELLMSRYGMRYSTTDSAATPRFIQSVKSALLAGQTPALGWLRAWTATR